MEQNKMTKYGVLVAAGVASVLIGGCGTESSVTTPADKKDLMKWNICRRKLIRKNCLLKLRMVLFQE